MLRVWPNDKVYILRRFFLVFYFVHFSNMLVASSSFLERTTNIIRMNLNIQQQTRPPTLDELIDQGFDPQYFNSPVEYPTKLQQDWYLKLIRGPIRLVNSPSTVQTKEKEKGELIIPASALFFVFIALTPAEQPRVRSPLKEQAPSTSTESNSKPKGPLKIAQKRPTVSEIENVETPQPKSPIPELNTEILEKVQNEVAKEILSKHKAEVEEGIQKRVSSNKHVLGDGRWLMIGNMNFGRF